MHEASIIQSVFDIAFERMTSAGATHIDVVRLRVGAMSGVVSEALEFAFEAMKADTPAAGARLEVEHVPVRLSCSACALEFAADEVHELCPRCGAWQTEVRRGRELDLVALELSCEG